MRYPTDAMAFNGAKNRRGYVYKGRTGSKNPVASSPKSNSQKRNAGALQRQRRGVALTQTQRVRRDKARAERAYRRAVKRGDAGLDAGNIQEAKTAKVSEPRAALHLMDASSTRALGRSSRKAERAASKSSIPAMKKTAISSEKRQFSIPKKFGYIFCGIAILALFVVSLYTPAQQYYVQLREHDRLEAEYQAVVERNELLEESVKTLQSDAGVEQTARSKFGLVEKDESAGSVIGLDIEEDDSYFTANVVPNSIEAPDTWYSGVLDLIFQYEK